MYSWFTHQKWWVSIVFCMFTRRYWGCNYPKISKIAKLVRLVNELLYIIYPESSTGISWDLMGYHRDILGISLGYTGIIIWAMFKPSVDWWLVRIYYWICEYIYICILNIYIYIYIGGNYHNLCSNTADLGIFSKPWKNGGGTKLGHFAIQHASGFRDSHEDFSIGTNKRHWWM